MKSNHFNGKTFFSPGAPPIATWRRVLRWWLSRGDRGHWPRWVEIKPAKVRHLASGVQPEPLRYGGTAVAPSQGGPPHPQNESGPDERPPPANVRVTWVNHSTFLIQTPSGNFITDPVYSRRAGPFGIVGPKRVHAPGIALADLPKIDFVLLSHDHYDHCDIAALRWLAHRDAPLAVTLLANAPLLKEAGYERVVELDWWNGVGALAAPGAKFAATVTATPAQHWSNRVFGVRNSRLWGGFWITVCGRKLYFAGDTGFRVEIFKEIHERLGSPDLAMLPIGAYHPRWFMSPQHCDPEEAVAIHRCLSARHSVAMHWGCFRLTDERRDDPPQELAKARALAGLPPEAFLVLEPGESIVL